MAISANIKRLRTSKDWTQEQLADKVGVTRSTVTQWETGWSQPRMGAVEKLSKAFGVTISEIVSEGDALPKDAIIPTPPRKAYAPLLGRVHAGDAQAPEIIEDNVALPYEVWDRHREGYFLQVEGNCMSKVYPEGCYIFVDRRMQPKNGSIAVVSIDGEDYVMRRLFMGANKMMLSPDSWEDGYDDIVVSEGDGHTVEFEGVVVWFQASKEME
ncbi:LexA family protein [Gordonibacter massiliensis (ex Traore et al. 2017)]|uniref:LexA family protein n=1 Tax=Gordonibacter massiliensis (ex Traore et al. 2017) TaxID=1841863 RepID=UPI001C8C3A1B|nr:XRE family transcriptional regulator [Gordonibacter massiliensis (ex Traore et al. 2017)]MBX9035077.1 helix-turn-helix domain-containing protein [Gordonibacter massiliensis (ex Traore et al. 2017)]